jgi:MoaA/NifB/PqqE/SkfB family radical SAM enzyme
MNLKTKLKFGMSVLRYRLTGRRVPVAVAWLITGRCNLHCVYCRWKQERSAAELDTAAVKNMIDQMADAGVLLVSFTGGEPLVRKDMGEIIRYVKGRGLVCKLNTNGTLVESRLDELRGLDLLQISVDGPPQAHDRLRGSGTSDLAARAVRLARDAGIRVQLITCLTRDNVARIDEVLDYGLRLESGLCFQILSASSLDAQEIGAAVPSREDLVGALEYLIGLKKTRRPRAKAIGSKTSELRYYLEMVRNRRRGCDCSLVTATLLPDGRLIFCGSATTYEAFDARELGFAEAFSRLTIPDCQGCVCVGKLRLSKVYQLDLSIIRELLDL